MMQTLLTTIPIDMALIQSRTLGATYQRSQAHLAISADLQISQCSAAKHLRAFANLGVRLIAGKEKVEIQANDNSVEVIANKLMEIIGQEGITLQAEQLIRLGAGGHALQLTPSSGAVVHARLSMPEASGDGTVPAAASAARVSAAVKAGNVLNTGFAFAHDQSFATTGRSTGPAAALQAVVRILQ
jgi:uncharacterized protein (DUF2345 family)